MFCTPPLLRRVQVLHIYCISFSLSNKKRKLLIESILHACMLIVCNLEPSQSKRIRVNTSDLTYWNLQINSVNITLCIHFRLYCWSVSEVECMNGCSRHCCRLVHHVSTLDILIYHGYFQDLPN